MSDSKRFGPQGVFDHPYKCNRHALRSVDPKRVSLKMRRRSTVR